MGTLNRKGKILIVDDTPSMIDLLKNVLEAEGYQIFIANNGEKAISRAILNKPELILLDILMPGINGLETCRCLKENEKTADIPVIFMTALTQTETIVKGFEVGAVDYVTKPFNTHELLARVNTHIQMKFHQDTILRQQSKITEQRNELQEIIHVLCHDLANPLHAMQMVLQNIKRDPTKAIRFIDRMISMITQGTKLLELVRELRAITEGKKQLNLYAVNLKESLKTSFEMLENQFSQKRIRPVLNINEDIYIMSEDTSLINSVFNNFLSNAIKFSYPDSIIEINVENKDQKVAIIIKDSGIGIPQEQLDNLFKHNKITTRFGTENEKGCGFGISLAKKFVTAYGGDIVISSKEKSDSSKEHGTEVKIILKQVPPPTY